MTDSKSPLDILGDVSNFCKVAKNIGFTKQQKDFICREIEAANIPETEKLFLKVTICGDSMESDEERKCVYRVYLDDDGDPYDDWQSDCGAAYTSCDDYMQPGDSDCLYCQKCGGKIDAIKEKVVNDE